MNVDWYFWAIARKASRVDFFFPWNIVNPFSKTVSSQSVEYCTGGLGLVGST